MGVENIRTTIRPDTTAPIQNHAEAALNVKNNDNKRRAFPQLRQDPLTVLNPNTIFSLANNNNIRLHTPSFPPASEGKPPSRRITQEASDQPPPRTGGRGPIDRNGPPPPPPNLPDPEDEGRERSEDPTKFFIPKSANTDPFLRYHLERVSSFTGDRRIPGLYREAIDHVSELRRSAEALGFSKEETDAVIALYPTLLERSHEILRDENERIIAAAERVARDSTTLTNVIQEAKEEAQRARQELEASRAALARAHQNAETLRAATAAARKAQEEAEREASIDPLTNIYNRKGFNHAASSRLNAMAANNQEAALLRIDLDGFKRVNDEHGHAAGDVVLIIVAQTLKNVVRDEDTIGRWGGDEFDLLIKGDITVIKGVTERIHEALKSTFSNPKTVREHIVSLLGRLQRDKSRLLQKEEKISTDEVKIVEYNDGIDTLTTLVSADDQILVDLAVTASIGVAPTSKTDYHFGHLKKLADKMEIQAKKTGKNRTKIFGE